MNVKKMRTKKVGSLKFVKKVLKKQGGVLVPIFDFTKTIVSDDVFSDGVENASVYSQVSIGRYSRYIIYESDSIDNDSYEYNAFEIEYEVTGSTGSVDIMADGSNKEIVTDGSTITGKFSGKLRKEPIEVFINSTNETINAAYVYIIIGTPDEGSFPNASLSIKKLTLIK